MSRLPAMAHFALALGLVPLPQAPEPRCHVWAGGGRPVPLPPNDLGTVSPEPEHVLVVDAPGEPAMAGAPSFERNRRLAEQRRRQCGRRSKRARGRGR